jgi:hypothetical protein
VVSIFSKVLPFNRLPRWGPMSGHACFPSSDPLWGKDSQVYASVCASVLGSTV